MYDLGNGTLKVRVLGSNNELILPKNSLERFGSPEVSNIPTEHNLDPSLLSETGISRNDLLSIFKQTDTLSTTETLALYWHNRLGHLPFVKLQRLARLGFLPRSITKLYR